MAESNIHYLFVVKAPGIALNMLRAGAWVTMANAADVAEFEDRKASVIAALTPFRGQIAVFQLPLDNPEEAIVVWAHNVDKPPALALALTPTPDQRDIFWAYVDHFQQRMAAHSGSVAEVASGVAPGGHKSERISNLKWWLLGGALCCGLMAYAVFPEIFRHFNWQGRLYHTVD